jgi:hypothetical protein
MRVPVRSLGRTVSAVGLLAAMAAYLAVPAPAAERVVLGENFTQVG